MNRPTRFRTASVIVPNLACPLPLRRGFSVVLLALPLALLALSPIARAVMPSPDGGYPNGNTAEGESALFSLTTGSHSPRLSILRLS
jgi:hypothetical protein